MATIDVQKVMEEIRVEVRRRRAQQDTIETAQCEPGTESSLAYRQIAHIDLEPTKISPSLKFKRWKSNTLILLVRN